ncbi:MAG TPA: glycoside hydrolase family 43 protein [Candidatus Didemnitutus sp.]|nr:glycoside hydrolase family 43 protein [Candidatus Didemnitutus sp.]
MKLLSALFLIVVGALINPAPAAVRFDHFEYAGRDTAFEQPLPAGDYRNPVIAGFYPDPSVCRVGDDFYLVNSTFAYFPGIPVFHSRDLVHWTQIGHVISRPSQVNFDGLGVNGGVFAPDLSYHDGTFYLLNTLVGAGGNCVFTARDPAGPWSDPQFLDFDGIDPSLFFDDDGRAWLVNNGPPEGKPLYSGHRAIWIQEFDVARKRLVGPRQVIVNGGVDLAKKPIWIEGPHLFRKDGWYFLICAEGGTGAQHSEVVLRSHTVTGPFEPWAKNPILTQRDLDGTAPLATTCTGHASLVVGPDGKWWATFLGCRPFAGHFWTTGRETFLLPVTWTDDDWPVILPKGERVPNVLPAPTGTAGDAQTPTTGNFTWRDDFSHPRLGLDWVMLRQPHETWWKTGGTAGHLELEPRAESLGGKGNPSFLGRRVQHARFSASISVTTPHDANVTAGLAMVQSETHYFTVAIRRDGGFHAFVEEANGQPAHVVAQLDLPASASIDLRVEENDREITFGWRTGDGEWRQIGPVFDALPVTVQAAGDGVHFTGAVVGPFARRDP